MRSIEINCMGCLAPLKWVFSNLTFATLCFAHTGHFLQWWEMSFFIPTQKYRCLIDAYILGNPLCPLWSCAVTRTWSTRHLGITMGHNSLPVDSMILHLRIPSSIRYTFASESPTLSQFMRWIILVSWACKALRASGFNRSVRLISFRNMSGSGLISTPSTMISPTSLGGRSSKKLYPNSCPGLSSGSSTSGLMLINWLRVSARVFLMPWMYSNFRL